MKKLLQVVLILLVLAGATYLALSISNSGLIWKNRAKVFEEGSYSDFFYSQLDSTEKKAYTAVRTRILDFPESIETPKLDSTQLTDVLHALINDDPYLFMFDTCSLKTVGVKYYFVPDYAMTISEYLTYKEKLRTILLEIDRGIPSGSEYDKELFFHDYIIKNCTYSNTSERNESNILGVFLDGRAKCSGYSKAMKLLLNRIGMDSILVTGIAENFSDEPQNHMWNAVKIYGKWYFTDVTWDDPISDDGTEMCRYVFFNASADMLKGTHSGYDVSINCTDSDMYYYNVNNSLFSDFSNTTLKAIAALVQKAADSGSNSIEFMLTSSDLTERAVTELFQAQKIYRILELANVSSTKKVITDTVKYSVDKDANLITVFFEIKD